MVKSRRTYRSLDGKSMMGRLLVGLMAVYPAKNPDGTRRDPQDVVASTWGDSPDMERRHLVAQGPRGLLMLGAAACALMSIALYILGGELDASAVQAFAALPAVVSALGLGLCLPLGIRAAAANADRLTWRAAGCPEAWTPSSRSQPTDLDVVWGMGVGLAISWVWLSVMFL